MLKVLSNSHLHGRLRSFSSNISSPVVQSRVPSFRFFGYLTNSNARNSSITRRAFFCSDSNDGSKPPVIEEVEAEKLTAESEIATSDGVEEVELRSSSAMVSTNPRPEDYLQVIALPLAHRPLFPGFYMPINVKDPKLLSALSECRKRQAPYAGAFLIEDETGADPSLVSTSETEVVHELKGKELYDRLHEVGTLAQITRIEGEQVILVGHRRLRITEMVSENPLVVKVDHLKDKPYNKDDDVIKATTSEVISTLKDVLKTSTLWRDHVNTYTQHIGDFNCPRLADFGAAICGANKNECQQVLQELDVKNRLRLTLELLKKEMEISKLQASIAKNMEEKISAEQKKYYLNEQLKAIKKELGLETDDKTALSAKFRERLEANKEKCPPHVMQVIEEEFAKLQLLEASSSEFNVTRNYLDWLTALPWGNYSDENFDVHHANTILDEDHYGLSDVKERILEFIAVGKLRGSSQGKIICLSGPPGVGKTSIGRSIARALNRKFYRFSVGGLADVAEIKGHRRTYIGAMPGKMVQCLKSVGTANPLVLIDEIDKLGKGHGGDPASALLELLDPEQNANFLDHYLDVPIDLSKSVMLLHLYRAVTICCCITNYRDMQYIIDLAGVPSNNSCIRMTYYPEARYIASQVLFVCTANVIETIPNPLLDRMEVISIAGYITDEKMHIARDYLEKTTREACGIKPEQVEVTDAALLALIENYCRESGVRNLQKQIEKIYRKIALKLVRQGLVQDEPSPIVDNVVTIPEESYERSESTGIVVDENLKVDGEAEDSTNKEASKMPEPEVQISHTCAGNQDLVSQDNTESKEVQETLASKTIAKVIIDESNLSDFVGKPVFHAERIYDITPVGVVMGLAWTAMGGSTLYIETILEEQGEGKGALHLTGQLGEVMKESAQIAHTVARALFLVKEPDNPFFANTKLHLHVPAGATPKDGPSAGCTMITSMLSLAMKKHVKKDLAMTGEVTLTGKILPIGGVKEKTIAAKRSGVKTVLFPSANKRDYDELAENVKEGLSVHFVDDYSQIFDIAFNDDEITEK
ncbi:hypothetical protein C5167_032925 [Papaver somniferum]|uniref:Lon protease homolog, mitochondrial n=1 Tax=Papaver somniferum TaxID=3469 RepID=A0A4Y7KCM2_PAPSO|nr:hypothetical protein C5167_032925 [Papaver somniferum]